MATIRIPHFMENPFRRKSAMTARRRRSTRARLHALIDNLELPADWTIEEFIAAVEHKRGRPIVRLLLPPTAPVGLCGLWLACENHDMILLRQCSDPAVEHHVVLHEVSHMLLGHGRDPAIPAVHWGGAPGRGIDLSAVRAARGVSGYASREEYEAELLATLVGLRARVDGPRRDPMLKEL